MGWVCDRKIEVFKVLFQLFSETTVKYFNFEDNCYRWTHMWRSSTRRPIDTDACSARCSIYAEWTWTPRWSNRASPFTTPSRRAARPSWATRARPSETASTSGLLSTFACPGTLDTINVNFFCCWKSFVIFSENYKLQSVKYMSIKINVFAMSIFLSVTI